jgi:hypothetical protein
LRLLLFFFLLILTACNQPHSDRVYSLKLDNPPQEMDWQSAPVHVVSVGGGRQHKTELFPDVDQDTVHTSTASCHHGAKLPEPIAVEMRSFYTDSHLYLQLSWADPTRDQAMRQWRYDGESWLAGSGLEDGFGILWAPREQFPEFSCARACHLDDFGVQSARFHAQSRMKLTTEQQLDLWNWKAARTGRFGFADDRYLDKEGMHGDLPGELFRENSQAKLQNDEKFPFLVGDRPVYSVDDKPLETGFIPEGSVAPGYLTELPSGDRADVAAAGNHADGRWTVVLRRKLKTGSPRDVEFVPGTEIGFGLSIMDNTLVDHYASKHSESLLLLPAKD